jgi:hypothetical protein
LIPHLRRPVNNPSCRVTGYPEIWLYPNSGLLKTVERYLPEAKDWKDLESALAAIDVEVTKHPHGADREFTDAQMHDWKGLPNEPEIFCA